MDSKKERPIMPMFGSLPSNVQNVARQAGYMARWGRFLISVSGAGTVFIATTKEFLEMAGPNGQQQGAPYTQANTSPPKDVPWVGEIWYLIVGAGTAVDFQLPEQRRN